VDAGLDLPPGQPLDGVLVEETPCDLRQLVMSTTGMLAPQARERGLYLEAHIDPQVPQEVLGDPHHLRQVLINLIGNAVKFTDRGGVEVRLTCTGERSESTTVRFEVIDTGIGIAPEVQARVFESFTQADGSTTRKYGGTGLGLAISREIAQLLGGRIELESQEGKGATFSLMLPLEFDTARLDPELVSFAEEEPTHVVSAKADAESVHIETSVDREHCMNREETPSLRGKRILIVDSDVRRLLSLTPHMEDWGLEVTAAGSSAEALETLEADCGFDVVVLNVLGTDSEDGLKLLQEQECFFQLPVIALVADSERPELNFRPAKILQNPVAASQLRQVLCDLLLTRST